MAANSLKANAVRNSRFNAPCSNACLTQGYKAEAVVATQLFERFVQQCARDITHFVSPQVFYEHKLREILLGTEGSRPLHFL